MPNGPEQAAYWRDFVIARCGYPNPARLAEQFDGAELAEFCACGCNSFGVRVQPGTPPLARRGKSAGVVFNADFAVTDSRQLEIMLSVDVAGNLDRVDVSCNANSDPVPHAIPIDLEPFHIWTSRALIV
ncbi:MAG: hypothetical protein HEQ22_14260 [Sphingopyxis sp.]|uniref:hypothetical protein n=1 Tax=Sphingopyxis sp. TaxID=1908224 RepID=UPI003D810636